MRRLLTLLFLTVCFAALSFASTFWGLSNGGTLYQINSGTPWTTTSEGATGEAFTDLAELNGQLYGITDTALYSITSAGVATDIGNFGIGGGVNLVAAAFDPANGKLYAAGNSDNLYTINLSTGAATVAATVSSSINAAGDLEFFNGNLFVTTGGQNATSSLGEFSGISGTVTLTNKGTTGLENVYGLVETGGILYGFTSPGTGSAEIVQFTNPTTSGAVTEVQTYGRDRTGRV